MKIGDLGTAIQLADGETLEEPVGTSGYTAPEVYVPAKYDKMIDIYSLGIVMWELFDSKRDNPLCGKDPVEASESVRLIRYLNDDVTVYLMLIIHVQIYNGVRPAMHFDHPHVMKEIIAASWRSDSTQRYHHSDNTMYYKFI